MFNKGFIPWNKGKTLSKELKEKISRTLKNKYASGLIKTGFQKGHHPYNNCLEEYRENGGVPWNKGLTGEKSHSFGKSFNIERKNKISEKLKGNHNARLWKHKVTERHRQIARERRWRQIIPKQGTKIELALHDILRKNDIEFKTQVPILKKYLVDIFIEPNIIIEADGEYWHTLPANVLRDKKRNELLIKNGYLILRFWGQEIKNNINDCWNRIKQSLVLTNEIK